MSLEITVIDLDDQGKTVFFGQAKGISAVAAAMNSDPEKYLSMFLGEFELAKLATSTVGTFKQIHEDGLKMLFTACLAAMSGLDDKFMDTTIIEIKD